MFINSILFSKLFSRAQGHSYPLLIELKHPEMTTWRFTSNDIDVKWNNLLYTAVPIHYKFPTSKDGIPQGGTLEIDIDQQKLIKSGNTEYYYELLKWFDELDDKASIDVVALINEQGDIQKINQVTQSHGSVSWDGEKISWQLGSDDRMGMQINSWNLDADALTG